ncbi:hypothetical protein [Caldimonas sp. KR1-144]|uniref:hypothetical protein n=1 Tax=Caldimonas sp. KR1-144 TaxID=3400911 RepID=UPI003C0A1E47
MNTVLFENPGEIDIRSISTFGVSVKEGSNPIGFFGTGLKYAIAVLLRLKHQITVYSGEQVVTFGLSTESVRGQVFDIVTMQVGDGEPQHLGFTTELGKTWEPWMAYREIACNCKDEGGTATRALNYPAPEAGRTKIIVEGDLFAGIHSDRHMFLLEDQAYAVADTVEIRRRTGPGFFYRGVRVQTFPKSGLFTYNETGHLELTEDRTVKHQWMPAHRIATALLRSDDEEILRTVLTAREDTLEGVLDFDGWSVEPSPTFLKVVGDLTAHKVSGINATALRVWKTHTKSEIKPREITLTPVQRKSLERAITFCEGCGWPVSAYPIKVVEALGDGVLGLAESGTIFVSERVFEIGGTKQLAATLIEEFLHLRHGWKDCTRELQNYLFEKVVSLGEEVAGEPL